VEMSPAAIAQVTDFDVHILINQRASFMLHIILIIRST